MNKPFTIFILLLLTITGCRQLSSTNQSGSSSTPGSNGSKEPGKVETTAAPTAPTPTKFSESFYGKIDKLDVSLSLDRDGDNLTGSYQYDNNRPIVRSPLTSLSLAGQVKSDGSFTLTEKEFKIDGGDQETGRWQGKLSAETVNGNTRIKLEGEWSKPDGSKRAPFSIKQESIELGNGVKVTKKEIKDKNEKLHYEFNASYPELSGSNDPALTKFNSLVAEMIQNQQKEFKKDISERDADSADTNSDMGSSVDLGYQLVIANPELISVQFYVSSFYSGAAHPNNDVMVLNYSPKLGKQLKIADLFVPNAPYKQRIGAILTKLANASKDLSIFVSEDPSKDEINSWNATRKGLLVTVSVPHAAGDTADAYIPYSELKDIIDTKGPLGQFIK